MCEREREREREREASMYYYSEGKESSLLEDCRVLRKNLAAACAAKLVSLDPKENTTSKKLFKNIEYY